MIDISERFKSRTIDNGDTRGGEISVDTLFSGDAALFGGAEIYLPNVKGLRIKLEYDAIDYEKEGFPFGSGSFNLAYAAVKQPRSNINIGLVYPVSEKFHLKLSYVKVILLALVSQCRLDGEERILLLRKMILQKLFLMPKLLKK